MPHAPADFRLRYRLPNIWTQRGGRSFGIYWSDKAGHGRLFPEPTDAELSAYYDVSTYSDYLSGQDNRTVAPSRLDRVLVKVAHTFDCSVSDPLTSVLRMAREVPSVCDLGCGSGAFLERAREAGATVVGIDPSEISEASTRARGIEFHRGTAEQLPDEIKGRKFDVVTMFQSLEHCRDPGRALANVASILRSGGLFCVDVPNMDCLGFRTYKQAWYHCDAGRHLQFFTPRSLKDACFEAGLEPLKTEFDGFTGQFTALWIRSMQEVWDALFAQDSRDAPPRPSQLRSAAYLALALVSPRRLRYDVVRVYTRRV